jgi:hypothetical protein
MEKFQDLPIVSYSNRRPGFAFGETTITIFRFLHQFLCVFPSPISRVQTFVFVIQITTKFTEQVGVAATCVREFQSLAEFFRASPVSLGERSDGTIK